MLKDDPDHWTRLPPLPTPPRPRKRKAKASEPPSEPPPDDFFIPQPPPPPSRARTLSLREQQKRDLASAVVGSVLFHILLLWGVGRMVPQLNMRLIPDTPSVQLTLVEPPPPEESQPLVLRRLEEPPKEAPPVTVPVPQLEKAQPIELPKNPPRPTTPRTLPKLLSPVAPPAPTVAETPAPPRPLPQIIKAPPSKLEDLDLHKTPTPTKQLMPKLTLPAPPSFGEPGGGAPGSAAPGGGAPGVAAPTAGARPGYDFTYGSSKGMDCSKAAMAIMSAADQEKCKVMAALAAAAALKKMQAGDRNATPLDSLGEKRVGFAEERAARAEREASARGLLGRMESGAGPTAKSPSTASGPVR